MELHKEEAIMTDTAPGASVWEGTLLQMVQGHVAAEEHIEDDYRELASSTDAPDVRFLVNLILEDEERHHRWMAQLADAVRALINNDTSPEIPWLRHLDDQKELVDATKRFLAVERDDAKHLRQLMKELHDVEDTTLWALLVRLMLLDTEKHIEILRFVQRRAKI
jgi:bacterioferritin (cytochrome b1)